MTAIRTVLYLKRSLKTKSKSEGRNFICFHVKFIDCVK